MQRLRALFESENFLSICWKWDPGKERIFSLFTDARGCPWWPLLSFFIFEGNLQCTVGVAGSREGCWPEHRWPPHSLVSSPGAVVVPVQPLQPETMLAKALGGPWGVVAKALNNGFSPLGQGIFFLFKIAHETSNFTERERVSPLSGGVLSIPSLPSRVSLAFVSPSPTHNPSGTCCVSV